MATAIIGPIYYFGYRSGYFRSVFKMSAVTQDGKPLPWYTYPSIDFLNYRNYDDSKILEFGGGQSTLWWAKRAKSVVTLEGDKEWYEKLKNSIPGNVELHNVSTENKVNNILEVENVLEPLRSSYNVIIIDGFYRSEMIKICLRFLAEDGIIICDNAEGYGIYEGFKDSGLCRVDFFGHAPGVVLPHATSIYFRPTSIVFNAQHPIPVISEASI
tara:strand:+ start:242 stop:883 length:642 start_codon:yes stop_codon:yes gene_type:complete